VKLQIMNLFMQFSPASCQFFVLCPENTFHLAPGSQTVQVFPIMQETSFKIHAK